MGSGAGELRIPSRSSINAINSAALQWYIGTLYICLPPELRFTIIKVSVSLSAGPKLAVPVVGDSQWLGREPHVKAPASL